MNAGPRAIPANRDRKGRLDPRDLKDRKDRRETLDLQARREIRDRPGPMGRRDSQAIKWPPKLKT